MKRPLEDAIKTKISMNDYAILNFGLKTNGFYEYGTVMPIEVVDKILEWRDKEYGKTR